MVSVNSIGLTAMNVVRRHAQVAVHGHRNGWGMVGRSPAHGMSFVAFQKFWRLAGVDHLHVNGIDNKFCEDNDSVIASARECLTPMFTAPRPGCEIMPVFSSGQSADQAGNLPSNVDIGAQPLAFLEIRLSAIFSILIFCPGMLDMCKETVCTKSPE